MFIMPLKNFPEEINHEKVVYECYERNTDRVFHYTDAKYYVFVNNNNILYLKFGDTLLNGFEKELDINKWYNITMDIVGKYVYIYIDGEILYQAIDFAYHVQR